MIIDERVLVRFIIYRIRMVVSDIIYDAEISERKIPDKSGICVCSWSSLRHRHSTSYLFRPYIRYTRNTKDTNSHPSSLDKYKYYIATRDNALKTFSSMGFIQKKTSFGPILIIFLGLIKFFPLSTPFSFLFIIFQPPWTICTRFPSYDWKWCFHPHFEEERPFLGSKGKSTS